MPHRVAVLVRDGVMPLELGIVHQVLGSARSPGDAALYDVVTCAVGRREVRTDADFRITVDAGPEALDGAGTVVVPAAHGPDVTDTHGRLDPGLAAALDRIRPGTRIASICTGAFVLAAAGLLAGRRATTHWNAVDRFRELFPDVRLDPDVLYVDEGDVLTSAGEAAGIDLCLHLVRRDHGAAVANDVARRTVVAPHRDGGQAQFVVSPVPRDERPTTARARAWALEHLDEPVTLEALAAVEHLSVRTFTRRFREEVGTSPGRWLAQARVDLARTLLEQTTLTVEQVASAAGFGTAASLRQRFRERLGVSPTAYRATFRTGPVPPPGARRR